MTKEDKQLVFQDLCARLPYGVQCEIGGLRYGPYTFTGNDVEDLIAGRMFKPYLRPMSSMTEEEIIEFNNIPSTKNYTIIKNDLPWDVAHYKQIDWLNKKMFDYRGLIPRGLANEALENMYKI